MYTHIHKYANPLIHSICVLCMCCPGTMCQCMSLSAAAGHVCCKQIYNAGKGNAEEEEDEKGENGLEKKAKRISAEKTTDRHTDCRPPTHPLQYATIATVEWAMDENLYL